MLCVYHCATVELTEWAVSECERVREWERETDSPVYTGARVNQRKEHTYTEQTHTHTAVEGWSCERRIEGTANNLSINCPKLSTQVTQSTILTVLLSLGFSCALPLYSLRSHSLTRRCPLVWRRRVQKVQRTHFSPFNWGRRREKVTQKAVEEGSGSSERHPLSLAHCSLTGFFLCSSVSHSLTTQRV